MFDRYEAKWIENDSLDEIIISPYLMRDHMPDVCASALSCVWYFVEYTSRTQKKKIYCGFLFNKTTGYLIFI